MLYRTPHFFERHIIDSFTYIHRNKLSRLGNPSPTGTKLALGTHFQKLGHRRSGTYGAGLQNATNQLVNDAWNGGELARRTSCHASPWRGNMFSRHHARSLRAPQRTPSPGVLVCPFVFSVPPTESLPKSHSSLFSIHVIAFYYFS